MRIAPALFATLLSALGAYAAIAEQPATAITISNAWTRATPGGSDLTAAFLDITTTADDVLTGGTSPVGRVEIHTHTMDGNVMKMRRVDKIAIKAGETHALKPGGDHLMLLGLKAPLKEGETVDLTLTFEKASPVAVKLPVQPIGASAPQGHEKGPQDPAAEKQGSDHQHH